MAIAGFGFTKINVEKKETVKGKINIKNNVGIVNLETTEVPFGNAKQKVLKFTFEYKTIYEPDIGSMVFEGNLLDIQDEKTIKQVMDVWKKEKKIDNKILEPVINSLLGRCNVESLILSREVNLPPPVPLPKVQVAQQSK